jgi:myo-inositol-1(or 4)-monophosphatase
LPELDADRALLAEAAQKAGEIALRHFRNAPQVWNKPGDAGPVTEADLEVDAFLRGFLTQARPDYGWLSEETEDDAARLDSDRVFIVDPIDGTRSFIQGENSWSHSLAIADKGQITAGHVYLPVKDLHYTAALGQGATCNGAALQAAQRGTLAGADILATRPNMEAQNWRSLPQITRHHRPSLAYRLCLVAEGRFDAMLTLRDAWEWDIAAGTLIAAEAGVSVTDRKNVPLIFNRPDPASEGVIAANPALHQEIYAALR